MSYGEIENTSQPAYFLFFMVVFSAIFAVHLYYFTVFDDFATFSNDAGSYVILARKWSMYGEPMPVFLNTWPFHSYPPAFPLLLALFGVSNSLLLSHMFVSACLLAGILALSVYAHREIGGFNTVLMLVAFCAVPGATISSMGILAENLYFLATVVALLIHKELTERKPNSYFLLLVFFSFLLLVLLTRSIGMALILAVIFNAILDKGIDRICRIRLITVSFLTLVVWSVWAYFDPQPSHGSYSTIFKSAAFSDGESFQGVIDWVSLTVYTNLVEIAFSFNEYLTLNHPNNWFFGYSTVVVLASICALFYRIYKRKLDAIYLGIYLCVLIVWPYPEEVLRFIHPIVFLIIFQLVASTNDIAQKRNSVSDKRIASMIFIVILFCSLVIQFSIYQKKISFSSKYPNLQNSYELIRSPFDDIGEKYAQAYGGVMQLMSEAAKYLDETSVVASVKHEHFAVLSEISSENLVANVRFEQQLCNLLVGNVDAVFISGLTTSMNYRGLDLLQSLEQFSYETKKLATEDDFVEAYLLFLDRKIIYSYLKQSSFLCESFRHY